MEHWELETNKNGFHVTLLSLAIESKIRSTSIGTNTSGP